MSQTSTPASSPTTTEDLADLPGFAPAPTPTRDPLDPEATTIRPSPSDPADGWDDDAAEEAPRRASATTSGSSRASTDPAPVKVDWRDLLPMMAALVGMGSMLVRWVRGRRRYLPDGVWIADEDDAAAIAAPLSRLAARRSPISGSGSADMVDGLEVLVGATAYTMKNLEAEAAASALPAVDDADV